MSTERMKVTSLIPMVVLFMIGCISPEVSRPFTPPAADPFPLVHGTSYLGVIVPEARAAEGVRYLGLKASGYWTPSVDIIATLESKLRAALQRGQLEPELIDPDLKNNRPGRDYVVRQITIVLERLDTSRRQYVGVVTSEGAKRILVNGFPGAENAASDDFPYWRQGIVWVLDGGASYWRIQYNIEGGSFTEFESNGYA
jgi:hypothetical protein